MNALSSKTKDRRTHIRSHGSQLALHFRVAQMQLCICLNEVSKVLPMMTLQPVLGSPPFLTGLMNLHGTSVSVIDLALRLGQSSSSNYTLNTPILLCNHAQHLAGMIVDEILGVAEIDNKQRQMSDFLAHEHNPFLAVFNIEDRLSLLLNLAMILDFSYSDNGPAFHLDPSLLDKVQN